MSRSRSSSPTTPDLVSTWRGVVVASLQEWGRIERPMAVARLTRLMPPGYSWQRYVIDHKLRQRLEAKGLWEEGDPFPAPESMEDFDKAQRSLALWFLRQLKREKRVLEEDGMIMLKEQ